MREVADLPVGPWSPPEYSVDSEGRVIGAQPGVPNNWGRWGSNDQRGTVNLLTADRVAAAARLVRQGKRFSLGLPIGPPAPGPRAPIQHFFRHAGSDALVNEPGMFGFQISDDYVLMALQGTTQIDALSHYGAEDTLYNGYWVGAVSAASGARRLGIHNWSDGVVGRGILLDIARHLDVESLDPTVSVGPELLDEVAERHGLDIGPGDIVLLRTGFLGSWLQSENPGYPLSGGLSASALPWLAERDVAMVAADNVAVETAGSPTEELMAVHRGSLRDLGLPLGELFDLDELAEDCARDGVYEFFFIAAPLPIVNGSGSPINPLVLK